MSKISTFSTENLRLYFRTRKGPVQAVDGVSFTLEHGHTLVIVGESGSGKSSLGRAILRLLPRNVHTYSGSVRLDGLDVMTLPEEEFRHEIRWARLAWVPQGAMNALNPVIRIGDQVAEPLFVHSRSATLASVRRTAEEAIRRVGVPADFLTRYPFELSGGMRQRLALAMALITLPDVVVLDEPTSALDVLTQANIMNVLKTIKRETQTSFLLITHDIATSSEIADDAAVMYAGQLVEISRAGQFYHEPLHPYSQALMRSVPSLREEKRLDFIPGQPPSLIDPPKGCRFADRCPARFSKCSEEPPLLQVDQRQVRCWLYA
jgi:oligopeptide/dipeptide ABC transporter ATP-binding protein